MSFGHDKLFHVLKSSLTKITEHTIKISSKDIIQKIKEIDTSGATTGRVIKNIFNSIENSVKLPTAHPTHETKTINVSNERTWKSEYTKPHLILQIRSILTSIEDAQTESSFQGRTDSLITYLQKNPAARLISVKQGAIRILLNARERFKNCEQSSLNYALSMLGYSDPVPGAGIRILSIDGGGIRALLVLEMLRKLEELTGKKTHELFDFIIGTSTGAILTFSTGILHKSLDEIEEIYIEISNEVFKQSTIWGTGNLMLTQSYYSTPLWEKNLKKYLGELKLSESARDRLCPKLAAVSAVVNQSHLMAFLFRNYTFPWKIRSQYFGSSEHKVWEAARASAAAPTYFEEFKLGDYIHQDGGILVNNPTALGIHEAKLLWPNQSIQCVVSFGTGRTVPINRRNGNDIEMSTSTSWTNKFYKIVDSATDTEGVHTMLNDLLPEKVYYRFNPYLPEMVSMVEVDEAKLKQLKLAAIMYLRRNEDKFIEAAKALSEPKTRSQTIIDNFNYKRNLYGI